MIDMKPYYQVKLHLLMYKASFSSNPPKTEDEKYAYDIIEKAYLINEKKIETLDYQKRKSFCQEEIINKIPFGDDIQLIIQNNVIELFVCDNVKSDALIIKKTNKLFV